MRLATTQAMTPPLAARGAALPVAGAASQPSSAQTKPASQADDHVYRGGEPGGGRVGWAVIPMHEVVPRSLHSVMKRLAKAPESARRQASLRPKML
jgi:hypothetical protein